MNFSTGQIETQPLVRGLQPGSHLSDAVAHALIDHLLLIETELAQIRRLLMEEMGL
jgi:hypothetical protein